MNFRTKHEGIVLLPFCLFLKIEADWSCSVYGGSKYKIRAYNSTSDNWPSWNKYFRLYKNKAHSNADQPNQLMLVYFFVQ